MAEVETPERVEPRFDSTQVVPHRCFACGLLNEHGMHLVLHVEGDQAWTELELDERFAGWEGIGHGGIVATILDEVMAWSLATAWGMTARMAIAFERPVPIGTPLRAEAHITARRRRVVDTEGVLVDRRDGTVLAAATGTYLAADPARQAEMRERYGFPIARTEAG